MKRIIYYKQYGLGIGFSTDHARIGLIVNIVSAIDNNFFFLRKKHKIIWYIWSQHITWKNIRGIAHQLFKSYLKSRKKFVSIMDAEFELGSLSCSVPEGSVLGPLLFLIYIHDLHYDIKHHHHFILVMKLFYWTCKAQ